MTTAPFFRRILEFKGIDSLFSVHLTIFDIVDTRDIEAEDNEEIQIFVKASFEDPLNKVETIHSYSIWGEDIFDLLDLSLCLLHFADQEDTTETIEDVRNSAYAYRAQWKLYKSFFDCDLLLASKNTPQFKAKRNIGFIFYPEKNNREKVIYVDMWTFPEQCREFALQLRECYESLQEALGAT